MIFNNLLYFVQVTRLMKKLKKDEKAPKVVFVDGTSAKETKPPVTEILPSNVSASVGPVKSISSSSIQPVLKSPNMKKPSSSTIHQSKFNHLPPPPTLGTQPASGGTHRPTSNCSSLRPQGVHLTRPPLPGQLQHGGPVIQRPALGSSTARFSASAAQAGNQSVAWREAVAAKGPTAASQSAFRSKPPPPPSVVANVSHRIASNASAKNDNGVGGGPETWQNCNPNQHRASNFPSKTVTSAAPKAGSVSQFSSQFHKTPFIPPSPPGTNNRTAPCHSMNGSSGVGSRTHNLSGMGEQCGNQSHFSPYSPDGGRLAVQATNNAANFSSPDQRNGLFIL